MTTKKTVIATLVEDFSLYPRHKVDDAHVSDLLRALQAGHALPPIIADAASQRIVDGFHRRRAYLKFGGEEVTADVEFQKYRNEAAIFMDAVERNSAHGRKLDRHDQTRVVLRLRELKVPDQEIALHLHVPEPQIQHLAIRVVMAAAGPIPSKRGLEHMRGKTITANQIEVMGSVRSAEAGRLCLELMRLLDAGLVDLEDDQIVTRLRELREAIGRALKAVAA